MAVLDKGRRNNIDSVHRILSKSTRHSSRSCVQGYNDHDECAWMDNVKIRFQKISFSNEKVFFVSRTKEDSLQQRTVWANYTTILKHQLVVTSSPVACCLYRHHCHPLRCRILFSGVQAIRSHLRQQSLHLGKIEKSKSRVSDLVQSNFSRVFYFACSRHFGRNAILPNAL